MTDTNGWPDASKPGVPLNPERDGWHWVMPAGMSWEAARRNLLDSSDDDDTELLEIEITVIRTHGRPKLRLIRTHRACCPTCGEVVEVEVPHAD